MNSETIKEALKQVRYPGFTRDIVSFGLVRSAVFSEGVARVALNLTTSDHRIPKQIKEDVEKVLRGIPGVRETIVDIAVTARPAQGQEPAKPRAAGIRRTIAIASGKGGVGKSTFAVNLACALSEILGPGKVGLMDCDIYGPSVPLMIGLSGRPTIEGDQLLPMERYGVKVMSMGFLIDDDTPVVWRGPMVMKTIQQFVQNVRWGELEVLVVDLPPGTGDAQLSLVQTIPLDGAVLVTTPQAAATQVARRGGQMFHKVNVPLLGVAENMSYFEGADGGRNFLFGRGGGERTARELGTELLGEVPLTAEIRSGGDEGVPIVVRHPEHSSSLVFRKIAQCLLDRLNSSAP